MDLLCKICSWPACLLARLPGIGPIVKMCFTSIGQKILMALTGLALVGFLVTHLAGNLLLFKGEEQFNTYAENLHSLGGALVVAEVGLFGAFAVHMCLAISTTAMSRRARKSSYAEQQSKRDDVILGGGGASRFMLITGVLIGAFLVLHVADMKFNLRDKLGITQFEHGDEESGNLYLHVRQVLRDPVTRVVYLVALLGLGIHLSHGISSAAQTLGLHHRRWNVLIRGGGMLLAWAIALGFLSIWVLGFLK